MHLENHPAKEVLRRLGITNPETVTTKQASRYLTEVKGLPTASSSLEVYRCDLEAHVTKKSVAGFTTRHPGWMNTPRESKSSFLILRVVREV